MRLTSLPPPGSSQLPTPAPTLSSLCNWWITTKEEALPGICHWFIHPEKNKPRVSISFSHNQLTNSSSFSPIGYSDNVGVIDMTNSVHSTSISLILILGGVFFILLVTAFITCITRRKRTQVIGNKCNYQIFKQCCNISAVK